MSNVQAGSEVWSIGGAGTVVTGGDGTTSITYLYDASGTHTVKVTVTGVNGSSTSDSTTVTV